MARILRMFAATVAGSAMLVIGLAIFVFAVELSVPLGTLRTALSAVASQALGVEAAIDGPVRLITGPNAGLEVLGARIRGGSPPDGWSADVDRVRVRVAALELFSREIHVEEADVEGARVCASIPAREPELTSPSTSAARRDWRLTRVERLNAERVALAFGSSCSQARTAFEIDSIHGSAPVDGAPVITAHGRFRGETWHAEVRPPSLMLLSEGSSPAPFELSGAVAGTRFHATGMAMPWPPSVDADVRVDSDQFATLVRLFDEAFTGFGPLSARARVQLKPERLAIRVHEAQLVPGTIAGGVVIDWSHERPRISLSGRTGPVDVEVIEQWLLGSRGDQEAIQASSMVVLPRETEGDLTFDAERLSMGKVSVQGLSLSGGWKAGTVRFSMRGRIGNAPIRGRLKADVQSEELAVAASIEAESISLASEIGIKGQLGHVSADLEAHGRIGQPLRESIRASVIANDARVGPDRSGARPFLLLRSASAHLEPGDKLRAIFLGTAWGQRLDARLQGAEASRLARGEPWHVVAAGSLGPLRVSATGEAVLDADKPRLQLDVDANAKRLGALAAGNPVLARKPARASGKIDITGRDWNIDLSSLSIDESRGRARARGSFPPSSRPMVATAAFDVLDLSEVRGLGAHGGDGSKHPLLPRRLALPDADLRISAERVVLPGKAQGSLKVTARSREGKLVRAPFELDFEGAQIKGMLTADMRSRTARVSARLDAGGLHARHLPAALADSGVSAEIGRATLSARSKGNRLDELAANARLDLKLSDALFATGAQGRQPAHAASLTQASLRIAPKQPTTISTSGSLDGHPLSFEANTEPLAPLLSSADLPFSLAGSLAGIQLSGRASLPVGDMQHGGASFDLKLAAKRLSAVNSLLRLDLPPVGPVALHAAVRDSGGANVAGDFELSVGESLIHVKAARHVDDRRHRFQVDLSSPLLRLEDLGSQYWVAAHAPSALLPARFERVSESRLEPHWNEESFTWRHGLNRFDAQLRVAADRITSAGENLGSGEIVATLQSGHLEVSPLRLSAGGAALEAKLQADLGGELPRYWLEATLDAFPYGALLRALDPMSRHDGHVGLKLWLTGSGELDALLPKLEGEAEVVVLPRGSHAHVLDPWGAGLVRTLVGQLDGAKESRLNCAVAAFEIGEGHARSAKLVLDSTRARAAGELDINLTDFGLNGWVTPEPKGTLLPAAWLPVRIGGTLERPRLATPAGTVAAGAVRVASAFQLFLSKLFAVEPMPADGSDECLDMYRGLQDTERDEAIGRGPVEDRLQNPG